MTTKEQKQQLLAILYEPYKKCLQCPLATQGRTQVVFGSGNPDAKLMIIGEAPGKNEDEQGMPFVGRSGQLLNKTLAALGVDREDIFITNIVKCRPPKNRNPLPNEISICKNILLVNQIGIIKPDAICTLGTIATQALLNNGKTITETRGKIDYFNLTPIVSTYHPAYIIRNSSKLGLFCADIQTALNLTRNHLKNS